MPAPRDVDAGAADGGPGRPDGGAPDAAPAPAVDAAPVDADPGPPELLPYGAECRANVQCETGLCSQVRGAEVCTLRCDDDEDCPNEDQCAGNRRCVPGTGGD